MGRKQCSKPIKDTITFMSLMNRVFQSHSNRVVVVFVDYILIYYKTDIEHAQHLKFCNTYDLLRIS
ncbi:RNA-directed DNA polymerase-like protein [Gossypium australe]|uniref:RNA-directed DNA polymerase-like protein n=1 Tax=Gossypium australe TaxID=47621 RepID=A0A5B6VV99_9ROSI|nr:RNA-directed DNA polymerase-like protein [Gossypium australe]